MLRILFSIVSIIIFIYIFVLACYVAFTNRDIIAEIPLTDKYLFEGLLCLAGAHIAIQTLMIKRGKNNNQVQN